MAHDNNEPISMRWEPLLNNLGHCCRKNKKYDESLRYHEQALVLKPQCAPTYTAIGFVYALKGNLERAVDYLHRSLSLKRDDIVTTALLKSCLEDLMDEGDLPKGLNDVNIANCDDVATDVGRLASSSANDPTKLRGMKITFDDESHDSDIDLDMSMD